MKIEFPIFSFGNIFYVNTILLLFNFYLYVSGAQEAFSDWGGTKCANLKSKVGHDIWLQSESKILKIH